MLRGRTVVDLVNAIAPLYLSIALGYASSKLQILPHEQTYAGIGGFVGKFSIPFLVFQMISNNDPYHMDMKLVAADTIYRAGVLFALGIVCFYRPTHHTFAWASSIFNMAAMPNLVLVGTPFLTSFYPGTVKDITSLVFLQFVLWISVCILLLETHKAVYENSQECEAKDDIVADYREGISLSRVKDVQQGERWRQQPAGGADGLVIHVLQDASSTEFDSPQTNCAEKGVVRVRPTKRQVAKKVVQIVSLKLFWSPVVWASILGFTYSLLNFKFNHGHALPTILKSFIDLMAVCTLGICMFMLGMNMGVAPKLIACGIPKALLGVGVRFIVAPACMAVVSIAVGLRGNMFRFAVMQAMVPQAILSFVWASQYNIHADIFSTALWLQTAIFFPFAIALNMVLELI